MKDLYKREKSKQKMEKLFISNFMTLEKLSTKITDFGGFDFFQYQQYKEIESYELYFGKII